MAQTSRAARLTPAKNDKVPTPLLGRCDDRAMATEIEPGRW